MILNVLVALALIALLEAFGEIEIGLWPLSALNFMNALLWGSLCVTVVGVWWWMMRSFLDRPSKSNP